MRAFATLLLLSAGLTLAQDAADSLLLSTVGKRPDCQNLSYLASRRILDYEKRGYGDSAAMINKSLEKYCGLGEQVLRYKMLGDLRSGRGMEDDGDASFLLDRMLRYRDRRKAIQTWHPSIDRLGWSFDYWADPNFDSLTIRMAGAVVNKNENPTLEIARAVYTDDWNRFDALIKSGNATSPLAREALNRLRDAQLGPRARAELFLGGWHPTGNLKRVNDHPYVGLKFGGGGGRFDLNLRIGIVMPWGPYRYTTVFEDSLVNADNFAGPALALEPSWDVLQTLNWKVGVVGGLGWTWASTYSVTPQDPNAGIRSSSISSPDLSLGIRVEKLWGMAGLWEFDAQYHFQNFKNTGGTALDGNSITANIGIGFEGNPAWMRAKRIWGP